MHDDNGATDFLISGLLISVVILWWIIFVPSDIEILPEPDAHIEHDSQTRK